MMMMGTVMLGVDPLVEVVSVESPSDLWGVGKSELALVTVEAPEFGSG